MSQEIIIWEGKIVPKRQPGECFIVDLAQPPYQVPCPLCKAYAMAPCRDKRGSFRRLPPGVDPPGKLLPEPHSERWDFYERFPQCRVVIIDEGY